MTTDLPAPRVLWFTGLSGAGKSTLADAAAQALRAEGRAVYVLDGDALRSGLCSDLGFDAAARAENIRRAGHVAALMADAGLIVIGAFISPFAADRAMVRALFAPGEFMEIYCDSPLEACERRDVKGLYRRARAGQIAEFTGISSPYEVPRAPELAVDTARQTVDAACAEIIAAFRERARS
ncbi:MAG: adenylyl-sulfate kinase [Duganella sp.]